MPPILEHPHSVDPHLLDSPADLVWLLGRREVDNGGGVEDDDVGEHAFAQHSPVAQAEACRDGRRHAAHGIFDGEQLLLPHVATEDAGIGAVGARMNDAFGAVGVNATGVGSDAHPRPLDLHAHVVLGHGEIDLVQIVPFGEHEVEDGVGPRALEVGGDVAQQLPFVPGMFGFGEAGDEVGRGPFELAERRPLVVGHLAHDALARGCISDVVEQLSVFGRPVGNALADIVAREGIRVHGGGDVETGGARRVDLGHHARRLAPIAAVRRFQVIDGDPNAPLAPDA